MRRGNLFWAVVLILVGVVLLLGNLGWLAGVNIWSIIWPLFLVVLGLWILWGALIGPRPVEVQEATIPLEGASLLA